MLHRVLQDLPAPDAPGLDAGLDCAAQAVERGERHLAMLARLAEMAMDLTETLHRKAKESLETPADEPDAGPDPIVAFNKTAQTVRRIIALEARLASAVKAGREALFAERAAGRRARAEAKTDAVIIGLHDAWAADCPEAQYEDHAENLMEDVREYLRDADEFRGYLDRPVGETVARFCAALDLDPAACVQEGETWIIRRPQRELERSLAFYKYALPPVGGGEGGSAESLSSGARSARPGGAETDGGWHPLPPDNYDAARAPP